MQLPLTKGDLLFFNPALFHAAGTNRTPDRQRMANLLQISSAFGKPMEALDRDRMMLAIYPALLANTALDAQAVEAVIGCTADGYSFPTNLATDPPLQGLAHHHYPRPIAEQLMQFIHHDKAVTVAQGVGVIDHHIAHHLGAQWVVFCVGLLYAKPAEIR